MFSLYIGDANEEELYSWLCTTISPLAKTTCPKRTYYEMYHGKRNLWAMQTTDVSDVSGSSYDTLTLITFKNMEDAIMAKLKFGGSIS